MATTKGNIILVAEIVMRWLPQSLIVKAKLSQVERIIVNRFESSNAELLDRARSLNALVGVCARISAARAGRRRLRRARQGAECLIPQAGALHDLANRAIIWDPALGGADQAEAYAEVPQGFRTGDKVQFTRNNYSADRRNGATAMVIAINPQGSSVLVEKDDGARQMLDLRHLADRHVRPGWVRTIHSSQGATCDRVMAHLESFRVNTVDTRAAYVAISRAREGATIYTDSRPKLTEALGIRDGGQVGAIDETLLRQKGAAIAIPAPLKAVGIAIG